MSEQETLSPEATESSTGEVSQSGGNESANSPAQHSESEGAPDQDWKKLYGDSTREAQRLHQENQQLRMYAQQIQQQYQRQQTVVQEPTPEPRGPVSVDDLFTDEELEEYSTATISGDRGKLREFERMRMQRYNEARNKIQQAENAKRQELFAAGQSLAATAPELNDPNSPVYRKTMEKYFNIINDPYRMATIKPANVTVQGQQYNLNALREAALEAKAELGVATNQAKSQARSQAEFFTEGSGSGNASPSHASGGSINYGSLLSESEKAFARDIAKRDPKYKDNPFKAYAESLERTYPGLMAARRKAGNPISAYQAGLRKTP